MSLYENSGYLSIPAVLGYGQKFNYIWGGRGTGKTYGGLKYCIENNLFNSETLKEEGVPPPT